MEEQDKPEKLDHNGDLQIAENGRNDGDDQRGDCGGKKEMDKEKERERNLDKSKEKPHGELPA